MRTLLAQISFTISVQKISLCQSLVRRMLARFEVCRRRQDKACTFIQATWRMRLRWAQFSKQRLACICMQSLVRMILARNSFRIALKSTCTVQARWRSIQPRRWLATCKQSAIKLQSSFRRALARKKAEQRSLAIATIQCAARVIIAKEKMRAAAFHRCLQTRSATVIQSIWKGSIKAKRFHMNRKSIIMIQSTFRRHTMRFSLSKRRKAILSLQYAMRRWLAVRALSRLREAKRHCCAATSLQCSFRRCRAKRILSNLRQAERILSLRRNNGSTIIQRISRGFLARKQLFHLNACCVTIQRVFRGHVAWEEAKWMFHDIILAQSIIRCWFARRVSRHREKSVITLQSLARRLLVHLQIQALRRKITAAITLQRLHRGNMDRALATQILAARKLQAQWRCYRENVDYLILKLGAIQIQATFRKYQSRFELDKRRVSVYVLQAFARFSLFRRQLATRRGSAVVIQSAFRMKMARVAANFHRISAVTIQRHARGNLARSRFRLANAAASTIQKYWRGYVALSFYLLQIIAATRIQTRWRGKLAKFVIDDIRTTIIANNFLRERSAKKIQNCFVRFAMLRKMFRSACIIQRATHLLLAKLKRKKVRRGIVALQSLARSRTVRKRSDQQIKALLRRVQVENKKAAADPKRQLGFRTRSALYSLQKSTRLSQVLSSICTLEVATRHSPVCCALFVDAGAPAILFELIHSCNRSLPHAEILHAVLQSFRNISRYDSLFPSLASETGVKQFINLVQLFRDKAGIFCLAASLLERALSYNNDLKVMFRSSEYLKRLKGVYTLCKRSQRSGEEFHKGINALERILVLLGKSPV